MCQTLLLFSHHSFIGPAQKHRVYFCLSVWIFRNILHITMCRCIRSSWSPYKNIRCSTTRGMLWIWKHAELANISKPFFCSICWFVTIYLWIKSNYFGYGMLLMTYKVVVDLKSVRHMQLNINQQFGPFINQIKLMTFIFFIRFCHFISSCVYLGIDKRQCHCIRWCGCLLSCIQCYRFNCERWKCAPLNPFVGPNNAPKHDGHTSFTRNSKRTSNHFGNNAG